MDESPIPEEQPFNLRFLRILVTILTATMILGLLAIVAMLVIRFSNEPDPMRLPNVITLPEDARMIAFTRGPDWFAVVTDDSRILIFDAGTGDLRQSVTVAPAQP